MVAFSSELVIRGVFENIEVNFLMIWHTHEDVDALFSKVSVRTINKDVLTLPALMAEIWESESMHPMPMLIEEVVDYKTYVNDYLKHLIGLATIGIPLFNDNAFEAEVPRVVWLGRCMGSIVRDTSDEHHGEFLVEWWRPRHRKSINATNRERYSELLVGQKEWEKDRATIGHTG
ncbi:hypothetical protein R1sor_022274 [Riccia sorocarpa]|uniref:DUF7869 domain-containing protein n=1 Tax=Riccia sorocarpa TaxID=122646 RepID=A0ABD3GJE3_9MARC